MSWETRKQSHTDRDLHALTCQVANVLKSVGVCVGERVVLYMPSCILACAAMQAVVRLGAVHAVVFAGFSAEALRQRINDSGAKIVITMDSAFRGGNEVMLRDTVYKALEGNACPTVSTLLVQKRPFYGIEPKILDASTGGEIKGEGAGVFAIAKPWPGIARTIYNDHPRYIETYFAQFGGVYASGDGASRDAQGFYTITGRTDDVINISGHRLSTSEIENILANEEHVSEVAVIGADHELKGHVPVAFVILHSSSTNLDQSRLRAEFVAAVATNIGKWARPDNVIFCSNLPKTRSGKIMRRLLRLISNGKSADLGDISTLADPSAVDEVLRRFNEQQKR